MNGRYGLEALDIIQAYDLAGAITTDTTNVSIDTARRVDTGTYFQTEAALGKYARVSAGIRGDYVTTKNVGGFFGDKSSVKWCRVRIRRHYGRSVSSRFSASPLQVSRGFRDPVLSDRYFRGPFGPRVHHRQSRFLEAETSLQFDLATRYTIARTSAGRLCLPLARLTTSSSGTRAQTDFFFFRNRGRARLKGFEVEARLDLGKGYSVEVWRAGGARARARRQRQPRRHLTGVVLGPRPQGLPRSPVCADAARDLRRRTPGRVRRKSWPRGATLLDLGGGWRIVRASSSCAGQFPQVARAPIRTMPVPDARFVLAPCCSFSPDRGRAILISTQDSKAGAGARDQGR